MIKTIMMKTKLMKNGVKKKIILSAMLIMSASSWAELPSWGMTENQYMLPNFSNKISEIGGQAYKNNWMLKVTAPNDWHSTIRNALTQTGERDVQVTFKDSVYQSVAISAVPGAKIAKISPSTSNGATVQKQVVIDQPEIDTAVEAPDFGDTDFKSNTSDLLENISAMEMTVPTPPINTSKPKPVTKTTPQDEVSQQPTSAVQPKLIAQVDEVIKLNSEPVDVTPPVTTAPPTPQAQPIPVETEVKENIETIKENLRKRHARSKRVEKLLSYSSINSKDELFIEGSVVLVKRFINKGVVLYFWMKEPYDQTIHKLVEKSSDKYQKDPAAIMGETPEEYQDENNVTEIKATNLDFIAVDTAVEDQDDLRRDNIRNKRVDYTISADNLKADDILYVQNQTVLVQRPVTSSQSNYFWLVGDTTISREIERKGDNQFLLK